MLQYSSHDLSSIALTDGVEGSQVLIFCPYSRLGVDERISETVGVVALVFAFRTQAVLFAMELGYLWKVCTDWYCKRLLEQLMCRTRSN